MSDDSEDSGVSGVGLGLGAAAGAGAAYAGDRMVAKDMVTKALKGEEGADKSIMKKVKSFFKNDKEGKKLASQYENIKSFNGIESPEKKLKIKEKFDPATFSSTEVDAVKTEIATLQSQKQTLEASIAQAQKLQQQGQGQLKNIQMKQLPGWEAELTTVNTKLGSVETKLEALHKTAAKAHKTTKVKTDTAHVEDVSVKKLKGGQYELSYRQNHLNKSGTAIADSTTHKIRVDGVTGIKEGNIKPAKIGETFEAFKSGIQKKESDIVRSATKGTGMHEMGQGLKFGSNMARGKVAAAVLGTVAIGVGVGSAVFPSHARRIEHERAVQSDLGRA